MPHVKLVRGTHYNTMGIGDYVSDRVYRVSEEVADTLLAAKVDNQKCFEEVTEKEAKGGVSVTKKKTASKKASAKSDEDKSNKADNDSDGDAVTV